MNVGITDDRSINNKKASGQVPQLLQVIKHKQILNFSDMRDIEYYLVKDL